MLTNQYIIAVIVPIVLILSSAVAKKLVRGSTWIRTDFFLGVELSLAAIASALTNFLDLSKASIDGNKPVQGIELAKNGAFVVICFFLFLVVLSMHQEWENQTQPSKAQIIWLGLCCNVIGAGLVVVFILLVKGI